MSANPIDALAAAARGDKKSIVYVLSCSLLFLVLFCTFITIAIISLINKDNFGAGVVFVGLTIFSITTLRKLLDSYKRRHII